MDDLWALRQEQLERALKRGHDPMPIGAVKELLLAGKAQIWFAENSTAVTRLEDRGDTRICEIWLAGGDLDELVELKDTHIEPWAKHMGASRMLIIGRKGWEKTLNDYNYASTVLIKELDDG